MMVGGRRFLRSRKEGQKMEDEGSRASELIDLKEKDGLGDEKEDVPGDESGALELGEDTADRDFGEVHMISDSDEVEDVDEVPFVKVEYMRGRRTSGRRREELAKLRAAAIDRTETYFSKIGDEREYATTEGEVLGKLNEFYSEILLSKSQNDPNRKRSLKGLML